MANSDGETVFVMTRGGSGIYHTDEACVHAPADPAPRDRTTVEAWGWRECAYCADTVDRSGPYEGGNRSILERILDERDATGADGP